MTTTIETRLTYDQIAKDYAAHTISRDGIMPGLRSFVALLPPDGLILDIGCGPGFDCRLLRQHGMRPVGVDYSWDMMWSGLNQYGLAVDFVQADMRWLPFRRAADGLWVCASFLHIPRHEACTTLIHFARVLKENGVLYLSVKLGQSEAWSDVSHGREMRRHFVYWQPDGLDQVLEESGFELVDGWLDEAAKDQWLVRIARKRS